MRQKTFYRVSIIKDGEGLWYDHLGNATGHIHNKYSFCSSSILPMEYDKELIGWISGVDSIESLKTWFPINDMEILFLYGYRVHVYTSNDYKFYELYQHEVFNKKTADLVYIYTPEEYMKL